MKKKVLWVGKFVLMVLGILAVLTGFWTIAYFVSNWGFRWMDRHPTELVRQLVNSVFGFMLFGTVMALISPAGRRRQFQFFYEMIEAIRQISIGNFHVNLNPGKVDDDFPMGKLAESINDMAANLKKLEELRQQFISDVSHEIQSPLTSISGFAQAMICDELSREEQLHNLEIIYTESIRLSRLSDDLLRLASLNSDQYPFRPEGFRLDKQLQLQILACEPQWLAKELDIEVDLEEVPIEADRQLLSQVWVNLLHNAVKFTPPGGMLGVRLVREGEWAVVRMTDTGVGISQEDQQRLFERFYKADKARSRSGNSGSGLGLSIVQKIVEMHRGSITVSSKLGEGTVFEVRLPVGS